MPDHRKLEGDGFTRETFTLPLEQARKKARDILNEYAVGGYATVVENWRQLPDGQIEFTMRRLFCLPRRPKADSTHCVSGGKRGTETPAPNRLDSGYSHNGHLPSQGDSNMANSEDSDKAFAELFELFSRPIKSPQRAYRTYQLKFENGEPVFTLSEADRLLEEVFEEMFGPGTNE